MLRAIGTTTDVAYPATYMAGPLHRLPADLLLVAPALTLLAVVHRRARAPPGDDAVSGSTTWSSHPGPE